MTKANILEASNWFEVLLTARRTQVAVMRLEAGGVSSESLNTHAESDQVLLVLEGAVRAEIGSEKGELVRGTWSLFPPERHTGFAPLARRPP